MERRRQLLRRYAPSWIVGAWLGVELGLWGLPFAAAWGVAWGLVESRRRDRERERRLLPPAEVRRG